MNKPGHAACFTGIFDLEVSTVDYRGSLFRFPLRRENAESEITETSYSAERVLEILYDSFFEEAPIILLFLKNVQEISLYEGEELLYKVAIDHKQREMVTTERSSIEMHASLASSKCLLRAYSMTVGVRRKEKREEYYWLLMNLIDQPNEKSQNLGFLPWVGIAAPLPGTINFPGLSIESDDVNSVMAEALQATEIKSKLSSMCPLDWTGKVEGHIDGHVFCFLPLPGKIVLPVNVHGYFAVADNRRNIVWPSSDDQGDRPKWNEYLVTELIAPAYSVLLTIRSSLLSYNGTPLPLPTSEGDIITDPYAAWPLYSEVKNDEIWKELLEPTFRQVCSQKIFWTPANKGKWVTLMEAVFLPRSREIPEMAIKVLIEAGVPVVSLPISVRETLKQVYPQGLPNVVTPKRVRATLQNGLVENIAADRETTHQLLEYILSDADVECENISQQLDGVHMLPLATGSCTTFSSKYDTVYVLQSSDSIESVLKCVPGMERHFVDPTLPSSLLTKLRRLAENNCLQLRFCMPQDILILKHLLPLSLGTWSSYNCHSDAIIWTPGMNGHPPISWLPDLWNRLCEPIPLKDFEGLPIIPVEEVSQQKERITLVPLPDHNSSSNAYFIDNNRTLVSSVILGKLGATVIHNNRFVFNHPDITSYISEINISTILSLLTNCQDKVCDILDNEKAALRKEIARNCDTDRDTVKQFRDLIVKLPIFEVGVGATEQCLVALHDPAPVLPPEGLHFPSTIHFPCNILPRKEPSVINLLHTLGIQELSLRSLCCDHLIPFALSQCNQSNRWCNGDEIFKWILSKATDEEVFGLNNTPFVRTSTDLSVLFKPCQLYSYEEEFRTLFNKDEDQVFACIEYREKKMADKLELCGLQTWKQLTSCPEKLSLILKERATSVSNEEMLSIDSTHQKSGFILQVAASHPRSNLVLEHLKEIPFLAPQLTCPGFFPAGLTWFGACNKQLHALSDMCVPMDRKSAYLVGSVRPILQNDYVITESVGRCSYQPTAQDVIAQLTMLGDIEEVHDTSVITAMVRQIYGFLVSSSEFSPNDLPMNWIWCGNACSFQPASRFAIQTPISLEPFIFSISSDQFLSEYKGLFAKVGIQDTVPDSFLVEILRELSETSELSQHGIRLSLSILQYLHRIKYSNVDEVLMLTADNTLKPAKQCVYVDKEWIKQRVANTKHSFTFVNGDVSADVAQYFGAESLSQKIAPSKKIVVDRDAIDPNETITRIIGGIVKDYSGDLDIFKELIQNADDAKATQVKFVIDWRQHGKQHLLAEELGCWQGPALIAYNNAVFSDEDLVNICKLAAETKLKDPLKTGRFGLGFCSTYYLTDVPSFISRRYFTMFDPHTWYLKDRVSTSQPGITIDLVESQEDLQVYDDQFLPFDGLFGCNVFKLGEIGFQGTIFRFPFRTKKCESSDIFRKCHSIQDIDDLAQCFKDEAIEMLLFLKNIEQIEVFVIDAAASHSSTMKKLYSVTKQPSNTAARLNMIQHHSSHPQPICSPCVIDFDAEQHHSSHHYLVASALSPQTIDQEGMIPLAEIAVEVIKEDNALIPKPVKNAQLFSFLPLHLPYQSFLPFHVNGFFDVGNDHCNLIGTKNSDGSKWNTALVREAVPLALECLMVHIANNSNLHKIECEDERNAKLVSYYSLWPGSEETSSKRLSLANVVDNSSIDHLVKSNSDILWCDIEGGKWVTPSDAYLFDSEIPNEVKKRAIDFLLDNGYAVLPTSTPLSIRNALFQRINQLKQVITYEGFFTNVFLPRLASIGINTCRYHMMFVLQSYQKMRPEFGWVKEVLVSTDCIPTQCTEKLVRPDQLVDPRQSHIAALYRPEEGRFPTEKLAEDSDVMKSLVEFGMISDSLPVSELVERASTVAVLASSSVQESASRLKAIFNYITAVESKTSTSATDSTRKERIAALWNIKFLEPMSCPSVISLPWCSSEQFVSPSQVLSSVHSDLLFSQKPVVEFSTDLIEFLGISANEPQLDIVLSHTCELISFIEQAHDISSSTSEYLDQVFSSIYSYIAKHCDGNQDLIKQSLEGNKWIWQDGHLFSSKQVLREWKHNFYPYLCQLSIVKSKKSSQIERLCDLLGVQHEATVDCLKATLEQVKSDFHDNPLSGDAVEFVIHVLGLLSDKLHKPDKDILLITAEKTLKPASTCTFDDRTWVKQKTTAHRSFTFVHNKVPAIQKFGVQPLSHKIAPSTKLAFKYTRTGPQESITNRIGGIVKDYSGDLDIFKELIQNADDAKATQVKFVLDWREHSKENLIAEELGCWQGPALIAYNNAVFSDEDLVNICKLAAETKLKDPLKTGRFGLGFCSTYYLTDVPSFISRRYFTMFDPHTWYLKDRVSPSQPGIVIDLVETRNDLEIYEDQFAPFDGLFGCDVFKLEDEGFPGTIFRFPFRTRDCESSDICKKCHPRRNIDELVCNFQQEASNILLFLKNVEQVEVYVLEENSTLSSQMRKLFAVTKQSNNGARLNMIQNPDSCPQPICSPCVIDFDTGQHHSSRHYLVASALSSQTMDQEGLIPLAEVAVEVITKDYLLVPKPVKNAIFFCFLPLPFNNFLPFHVNGFFDVGKDRRNLTEAQDSDGSRWNSDLVKGAVPLALECLITYLAQKCNMVEVEEVSRRDAILDYYSLWLGNDHESTKSGWLTKLIIASSKRLLSKSQDNILWCDINGGEWVSPCDAHLFDSDLPEQAISRQAISLLLENNYSMLPFSTPPQIKDILRTELSELNHVFTYERFFKEIFLPNLSNVAEGVRINQLMFALRRYQEMKTTGGFDWVKDMLVSTKCIPTQSTGLLVSPARLVDPRQLHIASLYRSEEGRFPDQSFTDDDSVMTTLVEFGMVNKILPISELVERAESIATNCSILEAFFNYIVKIDNSEMDTKNRQLRVEALWNIRFLKPKPCPSDISLPWCSSEQFVSPSQVFSSVHSDLLFSQKPVVEFSGKQSELVHCLGISSNELQLNIILNHTCKLISFIGQAHDISSSTSEYLDQVFSSIYSYIAKHRDGNQDLIKQSLEGQKWIWQDGHLLSSKQVLREWKHDLCPYLCQLSITKSKKSSEMERLCELLGVQHEATVDCLKAVLLQVHSDFHDDPLSDNAMEFVIHVLGVLSTKAKAPDEQLLVITADRRLQPAMNCVYDDREWVKRIATSVSHRFTFIHDGISPSQAKQFGIKPLSQKIAPSKKIGIGYKAAGPHESITRRISGIVKDYSGHIDIFKELIQNADDAKATQVKFVIDWRQHGKQRLLAEELGCWQGPALIAYNNAVFSDEDLDNICKLAAESKLKDPLKTGRFGLGFCSTYYLTDVPSFISRRYFTMFDPHTWYLKDRVSPSQPGITIDLVENRGDLEFYKHQFSPFNGLFGCKIFELEQDGFNGTIFRFPFRSKDCETSEICKKRPSEGDVDDLLHHLKEEASSILVFLKHVELVEVFVCEETASEMRQLFSVTKKTSNTAARLDMIENHSSHPQPICSPCVIDFNADQDHSSHHYLVASALSPQTIDQEGMIPLAEIAVEVMKKDNALIPKPVENALLFCFLPLPFESHLPFHVNGFFDVGKDRRNLTGAQDSVGSKWNSDLVKGAVPLALECLIAHLAQKCCLRGNVLMSYYSIWPEEDSTMVTEQTKWLANVILQSSKHLLAKSSRKILWCDINGGQWVSPCEAYLLDSEALPQETANQVVTQLLEMRYPILSISTPPSIQHILKERPNHLKYMFTYERFFKEVLITKLHTISSSFHVGHLMYALSSCHSYVWVREVLVSTNCIPTQCTDELVRPSHLIDPRALHIASLYSPDEGRFPSERFADNDTVMESLAKFGMISESLSIPELVGRANTVITLAKNDVKKAHKRLEHFFSYLLEIEHKKSSRSPSSTDRETRIRALWNIKFLKSKPCPPGISLPWCSTEQFVSPSQVFSSEYSALVFTQKPVVDLPEEQLVKCLGINKNVPQLQLVLKHIQKLITCLEQNEAVSRSTSEYLDKVFDSIYDYLATQCTDNVAVIKQSLRGQKWIWQNGHLHTTEQVLREWNHSFYPYLCQLSITKSSQSELFKHLGVQREATDELLLKIVKQVKSDFPENALSIQATKFVIHVLQELCSKVESLDSSPLVITADRRLTQACECVYDDREWKGTKKINARRFHFIHEEFSASQAKKLGVNPLSQKIAPSRQLAISYKAAGPHESITRRIGGIVKDYSGNIDIFKELIQNADDAKATQVKFVIDWRQHGKQHLLAEELGCWQGPALIAYNNAVFSDEDLDNICKLAAETKLKDPLKTGRFGLGFCSTYYLTDVPSFISRRYFTMFDPHTCYLKDRVSLNQPGMVIDLVKTREDLEFYKHQFSPFNGLFGCKIFELEQDGFNGTIFRFPFRSKDCETSEICKTRPSRGDIDALLHHLKEEASSILLFLKYVEQVEVFVLEKQATPPSGMKKLFSVTKQSNNAAARLNMIQNPNSHPQPTCSSCILKFDSKQHHSSRHYLVASALSPQTIDQPGMIPLAEIAVEVIEKDGLLIPKPVKNALFFCFLPLPFESHLPFHVNGFFDIGKDRRNFTAAQDSDGSKWNSALVKGAIPLALECLLGHLAENCNLCRFEKEAERLDILKQYYSLWLGSNRLEETTTKVWLAKAIIESCKSHLPKCDRNILWCAMNGGKWVSPHNAYLLVTKLPDEVAKEVVVLLLEKGYPILPLSTRFAIQNMLKKQLGALDHIFTYERFFVEIFIPNIKEQTAAVRDNQMTFALTKYHESPSDYGWVKDAVMSTNCIPTQCTEELVRPDQLIDPRSLHIASLYSPEEGRFPTKTFAENYSVMKALVKFGMISTSLPVSEIVERAKTVASLADTSVEAACSRMENILNYLIGIEPSYLYYTQVSQSCIESREERRVALWDVRFLKPKSCPPGISLPWCSSEQFVSPSQVFSSVHSDLLFSQKPVVEFHEGQARLVEYLGITKNTPSLNTVLQHITALIKFLERVPVEKENIPHLDHAFCQIYSYLAEQKEAEETIKTCLIGLKWIWQNGHLLSSSQVVRQWEYRSSMYLCELSQGNQSDKYEQLFKLLEVENEVTIDRLIHIVRQMKLDYDEEPLPNKKILEFVVDVIKVLHNKIRHTDKDKYKDVVFLLPDEKGVLRQASKITCDNGLQGELTWIQKLPLFVEFQEEGGHFLHSDVPRGHGLTLGAEPILDSLLKETVDDSFIDGTDFGQEENLVDRLNSILKKYSDNSAIFKEFIQNADDAKASELVFVLDHRNNFPDKSLLSMEDGQWKKLQSVPSLCIFNNRPFSESDLRGICQLGRGGKGFSDETIGRFGIGFNVAYHVTDCPMFITYDGTGNPTNFCVFDPLSHYLPRSIKNKRGRRWEVNDKFISQFPDQFKPFLQDEFSKFKSLAPQCLSDLSQGYVVFRLPFVRKMPNSDNSRVLCDGTHMSTHEMKKHFSELQSTAKECLLFLNNLRSISYFEISLSGKCSHHFTSTVESVSKPVNSTYQLSTTYVETVSELKFTGRYSTTTTESKRTSKINWLVHKKDHFKSDCVDLLVKAGREGLKPTGGVAAMLNRTLQNGRLFCFLPMLSLSGVPAHLNAHFLVDDSRKHLTTIKGLEQWNHTIGSELLVPSYVELILSAREYVTGCQESIDWFYGLFPDITSSSTLDLPKVGKGVYEYLLQNNHAVLLDQRSVGKKEKKVKWLCSRGSSNIGYFCKSHYLDSSRQVTVDSKLKSILLSLGMPITCAPDYVFDSFCAVSHPYKESMEGLITPDKVLAHLKGISLNKDNETTIKQNCELLLKFCIQRSRDDTLKSLLTGVPLLLSMAGTLETKGSLFSRGFSTLLPHCKNFFVNSRLEECYGLSKRLSDADVICKPDVQFVARNIQIPMGDPIKLSYVQTQIVRSLWEYLTQAILWNPLTSNALTEHFNTCTIIPAKDGYYYPPSLGKCIFKTEAGSRNAMLRVMKKLGYAELDQVTIGITTMKHISDTVSSSTSPNDVVSCLNLKLPSTCSVVLKPDEVNAFVSIIVLSTHIPAKVVDCLKKLPLFETVDNSFISLYGKTVSIVPQRVPTAGLLGVCKATGQVVLKAPEGQKEYFYRKVIDYDPNSSYSASKFYSTFLLPNLHLLSDIDLVVHLDYISTHCQDSDWQGVIATLKQTPLIPLPRRGRVVVSELCDPENRFYATFTQNKLLPAQWHTYNRLLFLRELGLKTTVTQDEWLTMARISAKEAENPNNKEKCKKQCDTLLATLKYMAADNTDNVYGSKLPSIFMNFLVEASKIKFIYCPERSELEILIKTLTHRSVTSSCYSMFTCFHGAVSAHRDHLAGLTRVVLPLSCSSVVQDRKISEALGVQHSLEAKVVVDNLVQLCSEITETRVISSNKETADAIKLLKNIFHEHYKFLEERATDKCIDLLADKECVLLFPDNDEYTYILVRPSQIVQHIPSGVDLHPFKYGVPYEIRSFSKLLKRLKVEEEMTPMHFIEILAEIKSEVDRSNSKLSKDRHFSSVCVHAFNALVLSLRQSKAPLPSFNQVKCYLPSEDLELMEASQLVYNDAPYIKSRLQRPPTSRIQYNFIAKPPPNENGQSTPPSCLGVTSLSTIAIETLHLNVDLPHNRCVQDELNKCQWVQNLLDTFNSSEFIEGLERLYWHEHSTNPKATPEFMEAIKLLYGCKIKCVHEIKTMIYVKNKEVQGTEDTSKHCHFVTQPGGTLLYISHNSPQFSQHLLMLQLAASIAKVVKHMLRNESHIVAILECSPQSIQKTLDLAQVAPYDSKAVDTANNISLGSKFEGHLSDQDILIICNYSPEELVLYHPLGTDEYIYARVVKSSYQPGCEVTNQYLELCTDMKNTQIKVSPLQVYKIFDISHKAALWKTSSSTARFTTSIALADVPCDLTMLEKLITRILNTPVILYNYYSLCHISLRLVAHMHYMLVTCDTNPIIFLNGVQKVIDLVSRAGFTSSNLEMCVDEIDKLVYKLTGAHRPKIMTKTSTTARSPPKVKRQQKAASYHPPSSSYTPPSQTTSVATPPSVVAAATPSVAAAYQPPAQPAGMSRFSQIPQQVAPNPYFPNYNFQHRWTPVPSCDPPQPPPIDLEKAEMWLQQAKADLLAAHYNLNKSEEDDSCKFPALVCFLTHDVVEKCLKGVLYAKCGLPVNLIDSPVVVNLGTAIEKPPGAVPEQFIAVVKECTMQVNEHVAKSRYPNYQVPPCAPATVYTVLQATEALAAAKKLMQNAAKLPGISELMGDLNCLPLIRPTTALSYLEADQGKK